MRPTGSPRRRPAAWLGAAALLLAAALTLPSAARGGQAASAQLSGLVRDPGQLLAPGVTITLTHVATGQSRTFLTNAAGLYAATGLPPGEYELRAELAGFPPLVRRGIRLETGGVARLDLALVVGALDEQVTVTADMPVLRTGRATLGQVIDRDQVVQLPLKDRTFVSLVALSPGVALAPGTQLPRINGGRPRVNEYLYDGISALQPEPGQVAFFPVIDAIEDIRIETNAPPAEFGRFNGGVINLATKSGTNAVRGTAFEFARHEALNARNFFARQSPLKPRFRRQQFGGVLGGPLRRDRTFFFVDYQGQRQAIGRTVISTVPTPLQRQGVFTETVGGRVPTIYDPRTTSGGGASATRTPFANNTIPADRIDPVASALLARYPLPTAGGTANNYQRLDNEIHDQDQFDARIDERLTARDRAFVRVSRFRERFTPVTPLPEGSGLTTGTLGPQRTAALAFASTYQRTFADRLFNELRVGDTRRTVLRTATELPGPASAILGLPGIPATARFPRTLPAFLIAGYQQLGSPANTATDFSTSVTQVVDALTWVQGRHTMKAGFDFRWARLNVLQPPSPTGSFQFSSLFTDLPGVPNTGAPLASFLLGQVQSFSIDLQQDDIRNRARIQEYFVQDNWRVSDRWTIDAGLRYTLNFPSYEERNQAAVFNLQTEQLDYLGRDGNPREARRLHKTNFGPRLGLVGRITDATVVGSGYGLIWIEQAGITTPFTTPVFPFLQTVSQRSLDGITPAFVLAKGPAVSAIPLSPDAGLGQGVFAVDRNLGSGYVQQWHVSLQHALAARTSIEVAYAGSTVTHVGIPDSNLNQLTADQLALGPALLERVPNPYYGRIPRASSLGDPTIPRAQLLKPYPQHTTVSLYRHNVGTTRYDAFEARLEHRRTSGLTFLVAYTRSRLMDDASSVFDASILTGPVANFPVADSFNRALERDFSTGDIPHVLASSLVWQLPWGAERGMRGSGFWGALVNDWTITGVVTLQSGAPFAVTQATNFNAFAGFGTQRPSLVGDPRLPAGERSVGRWFDTDAFAEAPQFTIGTSSRNPIRGPSYRNLDLALIRRISLPARATLEVRAEIFNVTNAVALGNPNGVLGTPAFGTIATAGDPRVVQIAAKLQF
jgi:hypothetical protein